MPLRARWYNPAVGRFNRLDPFGGNREYPQSLHGYVYGYCNPGNSGDPSGLFTVADLTLANTIRNVLADVDMTFSQSVEASAQTALTGGSACRTAGYLAVLNAVPFIIGPALKCFGDLVDKMFSSVARRLGSRLRISGRFLVGVSDDIAGIFRRMKGRAKAVETLGEVGARWTAKAHGFKAVRFTRSYHGFDQIWRRGNVFIIVEAKGGTGRLARGQMSRRWIDRSINRVRFSNPELARKLRAARNSDRLRGMVVRTRVTGRRAFEPEFELKRWRDIGVNEW